MGSKRVRISVLAIILAALLSSGCTKNAPSRPPAPFDAKVREYFGEDVCAIVEGAERVEVQRLDPLSGRSARRPDLGLKGDPVLPERGWIDRLKSVLSDSRSYGWDIEKPCAPMPGVRVVFNKGDDTVILLICFECMMLSLAQPGEFRWEDFDPAKRKLVELAKEAFPHDPEIQGLVIERE